MPTAPATREELFQVIAAAIGWDITSNDVAAVTEEIEDLGVRFVPAAVLDKAVPPLDNPYAPGRP